MKQKRIKLRYKKERVVLSDVLPYELPFIYSNRYFYRFLVKNNIQLVRENNISFLQWGENIDDGALAIIALLTQTSFSTIKKQKNVQLLDSKEKTIPFNYEIKHKETSSRRLSVIHPLNQIAVADFYERYKNAILYYCSKSHFSLRHPHKVACYFYHKDRLHHKLLGKKTENLEIFYSEYENLKSYFSYAYYSNIYKFYEDYRYQHAEKKYLKLLKFDIQRCFDSIYTHTISWAIYGGVQNYKDYFQGSDNSFADDWDKMMCMLNYNETNGIVIGPEFSRIFAEVILQHIDLRAENLLLEKGYQNKVQYECYRYVDDYFFFYNDDCVKDCALQIFDKLLKEFKMAISQEKTKTYNRPFITNITIAKTEIDLLLKDTFKFETSTSLLQDKINEDMEEKDANESENDEEDDYYNEKKIRDLLAEKYYLHLKSTTFNKKYKSLFVDLVEVSPKDVANYTLSVVSQLLPRLLKKYDKIYKILRIASQKHSNEKIRSECSEKVKKMEHHLSIYLFELINTVFFIYSETKRVNTTLKLSQVINEIIIYIDSPYHLSKEESIDRFSNRIRELVFNKIRDEISLVMQTTLMDEYTQLETLFLLPVVKQLNRKYHFSQTEIEKYLRLNYQEDGKIVDAPKLNAISIIILLYYIGDSSKYNRLRESLRYIIETKFDEIPPIRCRRSAENIILALDIAACPFLGYHDRSFKIRILNKLGLSGNASAKLVDYLRIQKYIFTKWTGINVTKELHAKISQEVYS